MWIKTNYIINTITSKRYNNGINNKYCGYHNDLCIHASDYVSLFQMIVQLEYILNIWIQMIDNNIPIAEIHAKQGLIDLQLTENTPPPIAMWLLLLLLLLLYVVVVQ